MKDVILILFCISFLLIFFMIIGDKYADKHPDSKFTKWWRKNVISENSYDEE
jgi:hypothetical protein